MSDDCVGPALTQCPVCGAVGLPERIAVHECPAFRAWRASVTTDTEIKRDTPTTEPADDD